jgi:F-type H+-transporting ATPase subunit b
MRGEAKAKRSHLGIVNGRAASAFFLSCLLGFALPAAVCASGGGSGEGPSWFDFTWRVVNFLILAGVLYWLLAKKVRSFFTGRREGIRATLADAVAAREEAKKKFDEYAAKLDKATEEIDAITRMIREQGLSEKERIIEDGKKAAEKMKEDTLARMEQEFHKASQSLRVEAVRLSTQMAEEILKKNIQPGDHEALVKDYIEKVVTTK